MRPRYSRSSPVRHSPATYTLILRAARQRQTSNTTKPLRTETTSSRPATNSKLFKETSTMKESPLTKNGVTLLYDRGGRSSINVQVVYSMLYHNHYYARLSDGKQLSPMVRFPKHSSQNPPIYVGHVIAVNQAKLVKSDPELGLVMDGELPYLYILAFTVVEQTDSLYGAGMVSQHTGYYTSIQHVSTYLEKFDKSLAALLNREETRLAELSNMGDQMRERGNALFKKGLYKQAAACYESASRLKLYDDRIFSNQSLVCFHLEEFSKALMLAMCAIKLNPFNIKAYYRACQCLEETKEHFQLFVQKRASRVVCGYSQDMDKFPDRDFTTVIPPGLKSCKGPGDGGGRARSQSMAKALVNTGSSSDKKSQNSDKKAKSSDDKKKKSEHTRDASKTSEKSSASTKDTATTEKKDESHVADKKKVEEETAIAPGFSSLHPRDIACISILKEGRRFYRDAKYDQALDFYRTAIDSGLMSHRPQNDQKRLSFMVCLCLVETGSVQNCIKAVASLKALLPVSPAAAAAAAAADADSDLPRAPVYYLLTMAYHRTWQHAKVTSFAALFNRWLPKDKHKLPLHLPAFVEPIRQTEVQYLEKWYAAKAWLKSDELVVVDTCRYSECELLADTGHHKHIVHSADLYTGHVELSCEEDCHIFYHPICWRFIKDQKATDDNFSHNKNKISDKDFVSSPCLTPDCTGRIESVRIFAENKSIVQEFMKERSPSETKPKKKKNKKKSQQNSQLNKSKNDSIAKDNSKSEVSNFENASKDFQEVPEPIIKKSKGVSKPGSTLPLDELDFESCNVKVIKREPMDAEDTSKKTKKEKKKKQRALDVERLVPDITDSPSGEQNEYLAKITRLNAQKEALERSVDCPSDQGDEEDDENSSVDAVDPTFYSPSLLQSDPEAVAELFNDKLNISSKYSYSRKLDIPTHAKVEALSSFLEDFIVHEGPLKFNDREFDSYVKENLPPESLDCINRFGGMKEFLNCSPKFVIMDDYVSSCDHVGYVQELAYADIVRDLPAFCISDQYQAKSYLESSPVFQSSSESSLTSEGVASVPSFERATEISPQDTTDVQDSGAMVKSESAENVQSVAQKDVAAASQSASSSRSVSVCSNASTKAPQKTTNKQASKHRDSVSSVDLQAPNKKDSSYETESSGLAGGFEALFNDDSSNKKERQLEKQVVKLQRKLDEVLKERNNIKTEFGQLQQKFSDLSHKMGVEVATLKKQLADAEENVQSRYRLVDQVKAESSTEQRRLNAEKKKLTEENKILLTRVSALEVREDCLKDEKRKLEEELEHANVLASRQTEQLSILETSLTSASGRSKTAELGYLDYRSSMIEDIIDRTLEFYQAALLRLQELHCRASVLSVPSSTLLQQQTEALQRHCDSLTAKKFKLLGQSERLRVLINNGRPLNDKMKNNLDSLPDDLLSINLTDLLALTQNGTVLLSPRTGQSLSGAVVSATALNQSPSACLYIPYGKMLTIQEALMDGLQNERTVTSCSPITSVGADVAVAAPEVVFKVPANASVGTTTAVPTQLLPNPTPSVERQISVGNLPPSLSDHQLKALFSRFGEVEAAEMLPALRVAFITFKLKTECLNVLNEVAATPLLFRSSVLDVRPVTPSVRNFADQAIRSAAPAQEHPLAAFTPTTLMSPRFSTMNSAMPAAGISTMPAADISTMPAGGLSTIPAAGISTMPAVSISTMPAAGIRTIPAAGIPVQLNAGPSTLPVVISQYTGPIAYKSTIANVEQPPTSVAKRAPITIIDPQTMSAVKQAPMSAVKQSPMSAVREAPLSNYNKLVLVTNKSSVPPSSSVSKTDCSTSALRSSSNNIDGVRTPTQASSGVQPHVPSPTVIPSPSHNHSQLSHFGVKPKITTPVTTGGSATAFTMSRVNQRLPGRTSDMAAKRSHERLADICQEKFGSKYSREDILAAIYEVRSSNNNRLSGLAEDVIIERVKQLVQPRRVKTNSLTSIAPWANAAPPAKAVVHTTKKIKDLENEDCCICISAMVSSDKVKSLDCGHFFHAKCINDWLNKKRECPLCRQHNVDKEEYPPLSSGAYSKH
ncbi:Zinc finger RING-type [Trinorchestia longiramus]|nr:Zinc finger RING-type [Trinorchestia longiramus]